MNQLPANKFEHEAITALNQEARKFRSLRWKISLGSSMILLAVVMFFCFISYLSLMYNFNNQREVEYSHYEREISSLIKNTSKNLFNLVEMIPFLDGMKGVLLTNESDLIKKVFDAHWALLQFHNNVELVHFYDSQNQLSTSWDNLDIHIADKSMILEWINQVNRSELPINPLLCTNSCIQYIVAPLLVQGEKTGIVVMGISLADALLNLKSIIGADIGLLIKSHESVLPQNNIDLPQWNVRISVLTDREKNKVILGEAANLFPAMHTVDAGGYFRVNNQFHQIKLFPLDSHYRNKAYLIVLADVTATVNNIGSI